MTEPDDDALDDAAMAKLLQRFGTHVTAGRNPLSAQRRAALATALDEVDREPAQRIVPGWRTWALISAAAALLVFAAVMALRSRVPVPQVTAQVARAEPTRGAPSSSAFTVDVVPGEPGFVRIDAFRVGGRRQTLPLRDGQVIARIDGHTRFGEFDLPDGWRVLVVFATSRNALASPDGQAPEQLDGSNAAEWLLALSSVAERLHRDGIATVEARLP